MAKEAKEPTTATEQEVAPAVVPAPELTVAELMANMQTAITKNDFKEVSRISRLIDQRNRTVEKTELDAKRANAEILGKTVLELYLKSVKQIIDDGVLDAFDGIWIAHDFGEQTPTVRLMKTATKTRSGGNGGTGKKFDISTEDMLSRHGEEVYKDDMTYRQAYDSNTDKNWRYAIRTKLLKLENII